MTPLSTSYKPSPFQAIQFGGFGSSHFSKRHVEASDTAEEVLYYELYTQPCVDTFEILHAKPETKAKKGKHTQH